jgi:hypothetical protein
MSARRGGAVPVTRKQVNLALSTITPEMYIYGCIIPQKTRACVGSRAVAASPVGTPNYGTLATPSAIPFPPSKIPRKIAEFFATPSATLPCVGMNIIHFLRAVIHKHALLRVSRASIEKFPAPPKGSKDSFKIHSNVTRAPRRTFLTKSVGFQECPLRRG